jgi:hypothetical protein
MQLSKNETGNLCVYPTKNALPADFQQYVIYDAECGMSFFKHPLLVSIMPLVTPLPIEEFFEEKAKWARAVLNEDKRPISYLNRHERAFRSTMFLELISDGYWDDARHDVKRAQEFWECAAFVWADCEEDESSDIWEAIIEADIPHREFMTSADDRRALEAMGPYITVYRGVQGSSKEQAFEDGILGYQWTLDRKTAVFFSQRFLRAPDRGYILKTKVRTSKVIAYLTSRGESEIIFSPDNLYWDEIEIVGVTEMAATRAKIERKRAFSDSLTQALNAN